MRMCTFTTLGASRRHGRARPRRRGFTLVELLVAGVITAFVMGSVAMSLRQIARAKDTCKVRYDAFMRADSALNDIRRDIASLVRSDDMFYSRFLLIDNSVRAGRESFERDELLMFCNRLRPLRNIDFNGEGMEYETQYRIEEDRYGPVLWQRRDAFPDDYPGGGGVAVPRTDGIIELSIQAYDGVGWYDDWDSDIDGLPLAVRITIVASGHRGENDVYTAGRAVLHTTVAVDRALSSRDWFINQEEPQTPSDANNNGNGEEDNGGTPTGGGGGMGAPPPPPPPGGPGRGPGGGRPGGRPGDNNGQPPPGPPPNDPTGARP